MSSSLGFSFFFFCHGGRGARDVAYQRREAGTHAVSCHTVAAGVGDVSTAKKKKKRERGNTLFRFISRGNISNSTARNFEAATADVCVNMASLAYRAVESVEKMQIGVCLNTHPLPGH